LDLRDFVRRLPTKIRERVRKRAQPQWIGPMLATLVDRPFSEEGWIFEPKLDGERCLTFCNSKNSRLFSRNRKLLNQSYPELAEPLANQSVHSYIVDGEIVAFKGDVTSFAQLQRRMHVRSAEEARSIGVEVYYYLFDLLYLNGYDLRDIPLIHRKKLLKEALLRRRQIALCGQGGNRIRHEWFDHTT
jgi:bifunctional non-homologous end joining protein LigD